MTPQRIGVVGLGLIGGSLACRLHDAGCEVLAWNHTTRPYAGAEARGIRCLPTIEALAAAQPDLLVLCNPLKAMPETLAALAGVLDERTTLTDVGSVKGMVRDQVEAAGLGERYIGAHPMAGNERSGWSAADPALYDDALWAVTVRGDSDYRRFLSVAGMITGLCGNRMIVVDDRTHDRAAALISHMPHVVATALVNELVADPERDIATALAAGSWRDMTRVALTDPDRTRAMVEEDDANVSRLLRDVSSRLLAVADALDGAGRDAALARFFAEGDPFRTFKTAQTDILAHAPERIVELPEHGWQTALTDLARRGEHIVRFDTPRTVVVRELSHIG
ncbi:prephenate dehydrogenase/arogenate dehydrogenase family protein [Bifidobacterium pullorum subsp. saeculare]|uniref:prephenate dehydrogenase n=1 Tax=Bifidobacterium pullorum TaxID=78448 RepID=UPI00195B39BA|nr:prephenate dehydrogenase/arogenate dehydrogenase family protein [Bifidobacterium pullorum]MBM6691504.1 prephenate dehydrogenase/arogenate dehydrogenase family protein [Bifidobacterium pullorum subsp. saeculare]